MTQKVIRSTKADRQRGGATRVDQPTRHGSFIGPWLLAIVVAVVGIVVHNAGGTTLPGAALLSVLLCASSSVLTWVAWRYAKPRGEFQRWHVSISVALAGTSIIAFTIFGPVHGLLWLYGVCAFTLCVTWNIRRADVVRGEGDDGKSGGLADALGLNGARAKVIEASPDRRVSRWRLSGGQTGADVQKVLPALAAHAGVGRDRVRVVENPNNAAETDVTIMLRDVLEARIPWVQPEREMWGQRSIAELLAAGKYEDNEAGLWSLVGDYDQGIPPGHVVVMGITRAGKTEFAITTADQIIDCYDAVLWWSDTAKGAQTARPIRSALDWYTSEPNTVKAQLAALARIAKDRADALGAAGYSSWTPAAYTDDRLRMPALIYWCEEAGPVLDDNPSRAVQLGEVCLSSGIFLVWSLQRASADRMPTSLRFNIGTAVCFGTGDDISATFVLSDATLAAGADPFRWKNRLPGRMYLENAAVDELKFSTPIKGYLADKSEVEAHAAASSEWRARLDEVSVRAAGETYARREVPAAEVVRVADLPTDEDDDGMWKVPPQPEPDLADMIDARSPLPPLVGEDVDLSAPDDGRPSLSPEERQREFRRLLGEFMASGQQEFRMAELVEEWDEQLGPFRAAQRPHLHNMLNEAIELGQVERVEGGGGRYRVLMLVDAGR